MNDDSVQNYGNHVRYLPPFHFIILPILAANALLSLLPLIRTPSLSTAWAALVAFAIVGGIFYSRWMPLRVQDRVIRLEEMLRLERLLPGRYREFERLSTSQLVALRFASDAEVPHIVDRIVSGEIRTQDEVKLAVQHWRPDHHRV
jgi:hypothetical protein